MRCRIPTSIPIRLRFSSGKQPSTAARVLAVRRAVALNATATREIKLYVISDSISQTVSAVSLSRFVREYFVSQKTKPFQFHHRREQSPHVFPKLFTLFIRKNKPFCPRKKIPCFQTKNSGAIFSMSWKKFSSHFQFCPQHRLSLHEHPNIRNNFQTQAI